MILSYPYPTVENVTIMYQNDSKRFSCLLPPRWICWTAHALLNKKDITVDFIA